MPVTAAVTEHGADSAKRSCRPGSCTARTSISTPIRSAQLWNTLAPPPAKGIQSRRRRGALRGLRQRSQRVASASKHQRQSLRRWALPRRVARSDLGSSACRCTRIYRRPFGLGQILCKVPATGGSYSAGPNRIIPQCRGGLRLSSRNIVAHSTKANFQGFPTVSLS